MADWGGAFSSAMKAGSGLIDARMKEDAEMRAADRKLQDQERLMAIREAMDTRAAERAETLRQSGRAADFSFDTNPDNVKTRAQAKVDEMAVTKPEEIAWKTKAELAEATPEMLSAKRKVAAANQAPERAGVAEGRSLENQLKQAQVENIQREKQLKKEFGAATPERKKQIRDELQILTGKDNDNFLPIPIKDEMGNITGYKIFDKKQGEFVDPKGSRTGGPKIGTVVDGYSFKGGDPNDQKNWEKDGTKSSTDKAKPTPAAKPAGLTNRAEAAPPNEEAQLRAWINDKLMDTFDGPSKYLTIAKSHQNPKVRQQAQAMYDEYRAETNN